MPGKPFQSSLLPYRDEIFALRRKKPPVSYASIAEILRQKYGLSIRRGAIGKFVKVRSKGRKVYFFKEEPAAKPKPAVTPLVKPQTPNPPVADKPKQTVASPIESKPECFEYQYSPTYNLHRLPPEEAAARRAKLEEKEKQ
jgi:hypothetical protein